MGFYEDLQAARTRLAAAETTLAAARAERDAARTELATLEASGVVGGPDVSNYQGDVDWAQVKGAGYDLVGVRIGEGDTVDPTWTKARVTSLRTNGLSFIPYYWMAVANPNNEERPPHFELTLAINHAFTRGWGKPGDLPLALDIEDLKGQPASKVAKHTVGLVEAYTRLMGHRPIVYTYPNFWKTNIIPHLTADETTVLRSCPLWIANYGVTTPDVPTTWTTWTLWQYTDVATVPGINGGVDNNRVNISRAELDNLRIK